MGKLPPTTVVRRYAMWFVICTVSAAPSFALAYGMRADPAGMVAAVVLFALIYGTVSCTDWFERIHRRPFVRSTMYIGYGLRLGLSLASAGALLPIIAPGISAARVLGNVFGFAVGPDMICGLLSTLIVGAFTGSRIGRDPPVDTFALAFVTTCVQGAVLNVLVFVVMGVVYGVQRASRKPPEERDRGFEVVSTAAPIHAADAVGPISLARPIAPTPQPTEARGTDHERDR